MAVLDPNLLLLLARRNYYASHPEEGDLSPEEGKIIYIIITFWGDILKIQQAGFDLADMVGNIAFGSTDINGLAALAVHPQVEKIEKQVLSKKELHSSVPDLKANTIWTRSGDNFSGYTGKGVFIGVIDTGIDFRHHAFRKGNESRIYKIWDQTMIPQGNEASPGPINEASIASFEIPLAYGVEYNNDDLKKTLEGSGVTKPVRHEDVDGHGTHVAGIAAGDGSQSGGCHLAYHYIGVAPDATLIVVRMWGLSDEDRERAKLPATDPKHKPQPAVGTNYLLDGIRYILNEVIKAPGSNKSLVINLSLGRYSEVLDGTSSVTTISDRLLRNNSVGRAIVFAAGNDGKNQLHAFANVPAQGPEPASVLEFEIYVPADDKANRTFCFLYSGAHLQVELQSPVAGAPGKIAWVAPRAGPIVDPLPNEQSSTANGAGAGSLVVISNTTDRIDVAISPPTNGKNKAGRWKIRFKSSSGLPTPLNGFIRFGNTDSPYFVSHHTSVSSLGEYAAAHESISVGAYKVGKKLADFSSRGPTTNIPARTKPDLAAPGVDINSAGILADRRNVGDYFSCRRCCCACCEDYYVSLSGTSMAAPHVAGLIALMLHKNPTLTHTQIRDHLVNNCTDPPLDTSTEDRFGWGAGKANAFDVLPAVPQVNPPVPVTPFVAVEPEWQADMYEEFMKTKRGPELEKIFRQYGMEVFRLINENKRVATLWHRVKGPVWVRHALRIASTKRMKIPAEVDGVSFTDGIARFSDILKRYGSEGLRLVLDKYSSDMEMIQPGLTIKQLVKLVGDGAGNSLKLKPVHHG